jgi:hypothetical protein
MKKLLSILCLSLIVLTVASCKKDTVVAPNTNVTVIKNVKSSDWSTFDANTYSVDLNVPELDTYFNEHGAVLVYIAYANGPWEQIPEVFDGQTFSFTHNPGHVTLYTQNAGGTGTPIQPDAVDVKIVLIDSN